MTATSRAGACWTALVVAVAAAAGCTIDNGSDEPSGVTGTVEDSDRWDLTEPPSRADVGMPDGQSVAVYETDDDRSITFELPEDVTLTVEAYLVAWDSMLRSSPQSDAPGSVAVTSGYTDLETAQRRFTEAADTLGLPAAPVSRWVRAAADADGVERVESDPVRGRLGFLRLSVSGRFVPPEDKALLTYSFVWAPASSSG